MAVKSGEGIAKISDKLWGIGDSSLVKHSETHIILSHYLVVKNQPTFSGHGAHFFRKFYIILCFQAVKGIVTAILAHKDFYHEQVTHNFSKISVAHTNTSYTTYNAHTHPPLSADLHVVNSGYPVATLTFRPHLTFICRLSTILG